MMEGEILALHFITLLHIVHVALPPLCGSWRRVPLCEVDELHLICCQALNGDYSAQQTKQCLLSSYDWDLLARSAVRKLFTLYRLQKKTEFSIFFWTSGCQK